MQKKWQVLSDPPQSFYEEHPELPKIVANLLYNRGIETQEKIDEFLNPDYSTDIHDPMLFNDMEKAVNRIMSAIEKEERIIVHGDYDADGVSGAVIITSFFRAMGHKNYDVFLPHRETDGYGLNKNTVRLLKDEGANVIITCDCGVSNVEETALANEFGMDVIITDHHSIPAILPKALAIIHPKIDGEKYPDKNLAGGAVAFKLVQGLLTKHQETNELLPNDMKHDGFEKWLLDMVAIASVADMVPLLGESRTLTKYGLLVLNKTKRIGLQKLLLEARLLGENGETKKELDADTIGFQIAPRINAAGRINHANIAYQLLSTNDPIEATDLALELNKNNNNRKKITENCVKEADAQAGQQEGKPVLFVFQENWPAGVIGLIAGKIKESYQKPTIAMTMNGTDLVGSGRSVEGFNMIESLQELPEYFTKFGGHPMACGFSLVNPEVLEDFQTALIKKFEEKTKNIDLLPTIDVDAEVNMDNVNWELFDLLQKFEPFGQANPKPKYIAKGLTVVKVDSIGQDGRHLKMVVKHRSNKTKKLIGWQLCSDNKEKTNWCKVLSEGSKIDIVFEIGVNEWNGNRELQLTIVDLKKSK
ncbi:MAG: single-stranded-DNA-specific exonuclease RecJ [Candidatus Magasanikbacteria bacterium CG_4_10_14_0_2_um_filter_37_12]|uniref:Single-stranded-DNA-specific exonuclease RecJ n=1 Tax=Candidatus Magasanikbacteria bacterium CG_4_10_14_0_2_um_filter_37_12 TaxID=1974637 RepID=A0A2M7V7T3_9BACT|nr:MAG: single-stranded-DNA-specific exonuclease RecJ [Candidatus Magasanikbacteria bacterium CG_4_10_14_0_2_um_filter_37_12]